MRYPLILTVFLMSCSDALPPLPETLAQPVKSAAAISASTALQDTDEEIDIYQRGIQIMKTDGVKAGLKYFGNKPVTHQTIFGIGWAYWTEGTYDKAEEVCRYLLARQTDGSIRAHVNYLMGYLHIQYTKYSEAIRYFTIAFPIYQETNKPKDQFRTQIGIATAHYYLANYSEMEVYLSAAKNIIISNEKVAINLGIFFYLKARLAFTRKDYSLALSHSEESFAQYKDSPDTKSLVNAMIDISFFRQINGDYDGGYEMAEAALELIVTHELSHLSYFNTLNFIFFNRCNGIGYTKDEKAVRRAAKKTNDKWLLETLDIVLALNCP